MSSWRDHYNSKICTAEEAVKCIKSGDTVVLGHACSEPQALVRAMCARAEEFEQVKVFHRWGIGGAQYTQPEMSGHFRHVSCFSGPKTQKAINEGRADFIPCYISHMPAMFTNGRLPVDVAMVTVTPPDQFGYCSLGLSVDFTLPAARAARIVIAQVNANMPRIHGDSFLHVRDIDHFVLGDEPLMEIKPPELTQVEKNIGSHVADLIEDGATLQMGIGAIPDAVLAFLTGKKDLGVHTEMFSDGVIDLVESGVINCSRKTLHPYKMVCAFMMGSKRLFDWVNDNPFVEIHPEDYVNDPLVIMKNNKMVSINSALQVDLLGQVAADTLGPVQYSGVGGQVDFIRGAKMSVEGKSIIALPSTAGGGKISRITPTLTPGTAVTTNRHDVDYIVTEYGVAQLAGKSNQERFRELVSIAHPDFREELTKGNIYPH